jgi:hypothetical protein
MKGYFVIIVVGDHYFLVFVVVDFVLVAVNFAFVVVKSPSQPLFSEKKGF